MTARFVQTGNVEADLWAKFHKEVPGAERIENAISSGMPDVFYPTYHGWGWVELKMRYATYFYLQKFQLAFAVKVMRLPEVHWTHYMVWDPKKDECQVFDAGQLFKMQRFPYDEKKLRVNIDWDIPFVPFKDALKLLGVYVAR